MLPGVEQHQQGWKISRSQNTFWVQEFTMVLSPNVLTPFLLQGRCIKQNIFQLWEYASTDLLVAGTEPPAQWEAGGQYQVAI